jgi:Soluble lytic murein transglycosylase and related regulatory proteins (some contain LysM/invasin domains)
MPTPREAYVNDVQRQGYSGARLRAADFGSAGEMIGRAAEGLGDQVQRTGRVVEDIQKRDAQTAAQEADNIRLANRLKRFYEGPEGYFNQEGRNALLDQPKLEQDLRKIDEDAAQLLANKPYARELYDDLTRRRDADDMPRIYQHANKERVKYEDATDEAAFDLAIDNASSSEDPLIIEQNIATAGNLAVKRAQRKGMTDEGMIKSARQAGVGKAVEAIAQKLELSSPGEAQAFVMAHAGEMDPQDAGKLLSTLAPSAAAERAGSDIKEFLVVPGGSAPAAAPEGPETIPASTTPLPPEDALSAAQWAQESGGQHVDPATGKLTTSSAGAQGISQVMPKTGPDPGYGVTPLRNNSREEYIRFGNDYRNALIKHFGGNVVLGLTAYNWGPGNLEDHIKKVGDPRTGAISDAAFLNSIPNKEAREYAPLILGRTGVSVAGTPGPAAGKPVPVGQEIDLDGTINAIRNSDRTFVEKQALIAEATRLHSYGKQVKAEAEEALSDDVQTEINKLPVGGFTNVNQLPLRIRQQITSHPELYNSVRNMANTNKEAVQAEHDAAAKKAFEEKLAVLEQDLMALSWNDPKKFQSIDFYNSPAWAKMGTAKVTEWMKRQQESIDSAAGKGANHDAIRTMVGRYTSKEVQKDDKKMGLIYQTVATLEDRMLNEPDRKGKPLTDAEREALVMQATAKATYTINGKTLTGTRAEAAAAGAKRSEVDIYDYARAQLQIRWGRTPLPAEVEAAVQQYRKTQGGQ